MTDFEMSYFVTLNFRTILIHIWLLHGYHSVYRKQETGKNGQNMFDGIFILQRESNPKKGKMSLVSIRQIFVLIPEATRTHKGASTGSVVK